MNKLLVIVDMQNDFIDGALGSPQAQDIVDKVCEKIRTWDGEIAYTMDTHTPDDYLNTTEGKDLPIPHCMIGSDGWQMNSKVYDAIRKRNKHADDMKYFEYGKSCFGSFNLAACVGDHFNYVELVGLCTDVCVISNAILLRNWKDTMEVVVDASCCAGVTLDSHKIALEAMRNCGIHLINDVK